MIAYLNGKLLSRHPSRIVLDVHGVGYELQVPVATYTRLPELGQPVALHVHTEVREDALRLFGFGSADEKALFERLITVNGVGPKLGLALLSGLSGDALSEAIRGGDHARLTAIPGVGRKTAERLILELRDKLAGAPAAAALSASGSAAEDVLSALVNLGYAPAAAQRAVASVNAEAPARNFDDLFRLCLKRL